MNQLMNWTLLFAALSLITDAGHAWNIGSKSGTAGPTIHATYFLTPNNQAFPVHAKAYVGQFGNGNCVYGGIYDIGVETLKTGDFIDIDAFSLKSIIGPGYNCMTIFYTYTQTVMETFQLYTDGFNYIVTNPATTQVTIL